MSTFYRMGKGTLIPINGWAVIFQRQNVYICG
jgi:hypothetical protein